MLRNLESTSLDFNFWRSANPGRKAKIMASPESLAKLEALLQKNGIGFQVAVEDVQA